MPYAPWVFETFASYNASVLDPQPSPVNWDDLTEEATELTWNDLDRLLAAAVNAGVPWAFPLAVWPTHDDASEALITYDLPDGTRFASLCESIHSYLAPGQDPTWGEAIMWGLGNIRDTGTRLSGAAVVAAQHPDQQARDLANTPKEDRPLAPDAEKWPEVLYEGTVIYTPPSGRATERPLTAFRTGPWHVTCVVTEIGVGMSISNAPGELHDSLSALFPHQLIRQVEYYPAESGCGPDHWDEMHPTPGGRWEARRLRLAALRAELGPRLLAEVPDH